MSTKNIKVEPNESFYQITNGDCLTELKNMEDGKFDLIITSPPYNIGKSYETKTKPAANQTNENK